MIEVKNLKKCFKKVTAVECVSFEADDGQVTGMLGPNGAGKTTSLRMLYGLLTADKGSVLIDGVDVNTDPRGAQAKVGVLPDTQGLYQRLTAREHLYYYAGLRGLEPSEMEARAAELIELLDMSEIADRRVVGFSQGERMKVALARTLMHDPQNIVLDEPTNGLDVMSTRAMREFIKNLRDDGKCVLFSSHIMQEVSALCDKIVIISKGRVVAQGTPDEIRQQAQTDNLEDAFVLLSERSQA